MTNLHVWIKYFYAKNMVSNNSCQSITTKPLISRWCKLIIMAFSIQLWSKEQGVQDHLIKHANDIIEKNPEELEKIDALCVVYCGSLLVQS